MKITKEIFKDNAMIGITSGIMVTGLCYFINKKCASDINKMHEDNNEFLQNEIAKKEYELIDLEVEVIKNEDEE